MSRIPRKKRSVLRSVYSFALAWAILSFIFPVYRIFSFLLVLLLSCTAAFLIGRAGSAKNGRADSSGTYADRVEEFSSTPNHTMKASERVGMKDTAARKEKKSYGPEIDPIIEEGGRAMSEMGRLYSTIKDDAVRAKINEIMRITDKITQDAIEDPSDIPQIKKFFRYYLPTTIKLLNAYDRMSSQGIEGENIGKSMKNINEMLDVSIEAYRKRLDSLFENQALDIETDIDVLNQMLEREGLSGKNDFAVSQSAAATQQKGI